MKKLSNSTKWEFKNTFHHQCRFNRGIQKVTEPQFNNA
ncbi:hypothetical protein BTN49_2191 [Candidatus Enterovibrio escicola]|uniref:Uncharacterized protein n=1 Tax=Candidatus Enterovibrio escicola TaxID=1927127 RepID=A0A2A5T1U5_9GAMM|nr:hypothetical protein BTN49_2191 [Candidatus Enterovibrio escacola]